MQNLLTCILIGILGLLCGLVLSVREEKDDWIHERLVVLESRQELPSIQIERASVILGETELVVESK